MAISSGMIAPSVEAQVPETLAGPPVQVQPTSPEPGIPIVTINTGTPNPFGGLDDPTATGSVSGGTAATTSGGSGTVGSSDALSTMLATPWGANAVANAQALGVNPSALAATCVIESGCQNLSTANSTSSVTGAFQMTSGTFTAMLNAALAANPSLSSQIVPSLAGQTDPTTQSIAAAEYLIQGAQVLQSAGISNPTVLQVRGYYNFGPSGAAIATASPDQLMSSVLSTTSSSVLKANGVTPGVTTVGQWETSVSTKIGIAAGQSVLTS